MYSGSVTQLLILQVSRNTDQHPAFFAVYNIETTEIIAFHQVNARLLALFFSM